jgi:hypothetical protein
MTNYGKVLPFTGGGIAIAGVVIDQLWLAVVAVALVAAGAVAIRLTWRRGKSASES